MHPPRTKRKRHKPPKKKGDVRDVALVGLTKWFWRRRPENLFVAESVTLPLSLAFSHVSSLNSALAASREQNCLRALLPSIGAPRVFFSPAILYGSNAGKGNNTTGQGTRSPALSASSTQQSLDCIALSRFAQHSHRRTYTRRTYKLVHALKTRRPQKSRSQEISPK